MSSIKMDHVRDPKEVLIEALGDTRPIQLFNNTVLVAVYVRPEATKGGVILPTSAHKEDRVQSKVGLVIALGPSAFNDPSGAYFQTGGAALYDWVIFRPSDGWQTEVNGQLCRFFADTSIRGKIDHPDRIW